ncbi:thrombospondin type 3 repeat-containing protein [Nannocystaceae bacterium ST9]
MARVESLLVLGLPLGLLVSTSGCISDTACGICDPDRLVLESITGPNYADRPIHLLTPGRDQGMYFIDEIGACLESADATNPEVAIRGAQEWCKISPLVTVDGLEFVFNNLLDPTTVELIRKQPNNPNLFEVYDWKTRIAHLEGPITRFNGDYRPAPSDSADVVTRAINLSCIDNLRAQGIDFDHEALAAGACDDFQIDDEGVRWPLEMQLAGKVESYRGETDWRTADCTSPDDGPDTCCNVCDFELSVNVAKYGLTGEGGPRRTDVDAITCDPEANVYEQCAGFVVEVDRRFELNRYAYEWAGQVDTWRLPLYDKVRETHPDLRPAGAEPIGPSCLSDADCDAGLGGDSGTVCLGQTGEGVACSPDTPGCGQGTCQAEWFVDCKPAPDLGQVGTCVDRRFKDKGAGACYVATEDFQTCSPVDGSCSSLDRGNRLIQADAGEFPDGTLSAVEGCQASLGSPDGVCDPLFQPKVAPIARFDRDRALPSETRECYCGDPSRQPEECGESIAEFCTAPWGSLERHDGESNEGAYITRMVAKRGGVIYDPALKGVLWYPADVGNQPRSLVESCAEVALNPDLVGGRSVLDGWRMHDGSSIETRDFFESYENFDRGMCSGSTYTVVFADEGERLRDKVGNRLDELRYTFETPEFHVVPGSGFPTDNLRIGACQQFSIDLSNKYDLDPRNLAKLELWSLERIAGSDAQGQDCGESLAPECWQPSERVAGGRDCSEDPEQVADSDGAIAPCLTVDVTRQRLGKVGVEVDPVRFGARLASTDGGGSGRYRLRVPGLDRVASFAELDLSDPNDLAAYDAAFHDVCGMPLIAEGGQGYTDFLYDFTVDPPKCKEDLDGDGVPFSCDNADALPNTDQDDQDLDNFGDVEDLCVLTASLTNTSDSDRDGIGNDCDVCRKQPDAYNQGGVLIDNPKFLIRNAPLQTDFDRDGVGDACDNCVATPNCGGFGVDQVPHQVGVPVPDEDEGVCQQDLDADQVGDGCADLPALPGAAGTVGFADDQDFDQDGIVNLDDTCPRHPVDPASCTMGEPCLHRDWDGDQVGDVCDTCPFAANPAQALGDMQIALDDEDGDGVGLVCETTSACEEQADPHPYGFYEVAVEGLCCTTLYPGDGSYVLEPDGTWGCEGLCDPDGFPIQRECVDEADLEVDQPDGVKCRPLPDAFASRYGVLELAPGCAEALAAAGKCDPGDPDCAPDQANRYLSLDDIEDPDALWGNLCLLPQLDQDFDGIGDACDLCPYMYDPSNAFYVDPVTFKQYEDRGRYCNGEYSPEALCPMDEIEGETETSGSETSESG